MLFRSNGYLCWPIIGVFKGKIVCMYTNANQHEATRANPYFMLSSNGVVWNSPKNMVPLQTKRIDITCCGNDSQGNLLAWVRFASFSDHRVMRYDGVSWVEISKPTLPFTGGHSSNIFDVDGKLMCFYNAYYASFGVLISEDDGETWTQIEISNGYISTTMPCEISGVYLGDGKILAIARRDGGGQKMLQLQSSDSGATWTLADTNIVTNGNTPSLLIDENNDISFYYFDRAVGRICLFNKNLSEVWSNPTAWGSPTVLLSGLETDGGNIHTIKYKGSEISFFYTGGAIDNGIYVYIK